MSTMSKPWLQTRFPVLESFRSYLTAPVLPREKPYLASLPVLIAGALVFQLLSGLVLSLFYNPADAFNSIQFIDRSVNYGWLIHAFHETGTTMIFGAVYLGLVRALWLRSYKAPGELVWFLSLAKFLLLLLIGYLGYVLADGAVSYWSLATSIAGAFSLSGVPGGIGVWFFGGPDGAGTLPRLAVFHAVLAVAMIGIVLLHHAARRGAEPPVARGVGLHPYYTSQIFVAFVVYALIFAVLVFFAPHLGENPLNRGPANALVLPVAVTAPWYLLPLSNAGHVFAGVWGTLFAVVARIALLAALPWLDRSAPGKAPGALHKFLVFVLALDVILICVWAMQAPSFIGGILLVLFTAYYFFHFLVLLPLTTALEAR
jgi:ubiquinol-cytochrome c reductase cytochrome b subunit